MPGGVNAPLSAEVRDRILADLPAAKTIARRTLDFFKGVVDQFAEEIANFGNVPTLYAGLVDAAGGSSSTTAGCDSATPKATSSPTRSAPRQYAQYIAESHPAEHLPESALSTSPSDIRKASTGWVRWRA